MLRINLRNPPSGISLHKDRAHPNPAAIHSNATAEASHAGQEVTTSVDGTKETEKKKNGLREVRATAKTLESRVIPRRSLTETVTKAQNDHEAMRITAWTE